MPMNRSPTSVLMVAYGGGHIAMVLPVIRALRARVPGARIDLLALTTAKRAALEAGETPLGYADLMHLLSPAERRQALALGRTLQEGNGHPDIPEAETLAYLGINALDLYQRLGPDAAQEVLAKKGRHGFYPIGFLRRVIDHLQPDLVIATNAPRSEQAALDAAGDAGIPTLAMLDLFGISAAPVAGQLVSRALRLPTPSSGSASFFADTFASRTRRPSRVCVLAGAVRENLVASGWPREMIAITGNPAFDVLFDPVTRDAAIALRKRLGWENKKIVLLAAQPEPRGNPASHWPSGDALAQAMESQLRVWVTTRADAALIVRHHPNHWHRYPRLPDTTQVHFSVPGDEAIDPLILASNCVVVQITTVGLQAATVGIPVLAMQCSPGALSAFSYAALGVAQGVPDVPDLPAALDFALDHPSPATAWARKSRAAEAVAREALALIAPRSRDAIESARDQ